MPSLGGMALAIDPLHRGAHEFLLEIGDIAKGRVSLASLEIACPCCGELDEFFAAYVTEPPIASGDRGQSMRPKTDIFITRID